MAVAMPNAILAYQEPALPEQLMTIPSVLIAADAMELLWQLARL